jgi:hypothetical protein
MKFTGYFNFTRHRSDRAAIKLEWIEHTFNNPDHEEIQSDGRIRRWAYIESESKFLRVIVLEDEETVHNAFFDRSFKLNNSLS